MLTASKARPSKQVIMKLQDLTDEELAIRARTDPKAAFDVLFERHRGPLYNFLLRQGAGEDRVDDLFQMAFLKAFRAIPTFREEARFKTWLYTIAVNVLNDDRRASQRRAAATELRVERAEAEPEVERTEVVGQVKEALEQVAPHHRQLFTLVRFQGLSIAEAARVVGMTPAAAKVTLFRTTKRIGELLLMTKVKR
jgi:RNA polymerase sigma-70 factor (ECF subfamily)